jgi:hypothetical protein
LTITNGCADALAITPAVAYSPTVNATMIAAGTTGAFVIDSEGAARPVAGVWNVPAMLGATPIPDGHGSRRWWRGLGSTPWKVRCDRRLGCRVHVAAA